MRGSLAVGKARESAKSETGIKVVVRLRPLIERQSSNTNNTDCFVQMKDNVTSVLPKNHYSRPSVNQDHDHASDIKHFKMDHALWSFDSQHPNYAGQEDVYKYCGEEFLEHTLQGYNTCLFAYGQTGSGKSYTMFGDNADGLIPRISHHLFSKIKVMDQEENISVQVTIDYFEIYNEEVFDLLDTSTTMKKKMRENANGPYVENLCSLEVRSAEEILKYIEEGSIKRKTAATKSNANSSRSHAVFTISLVEKKYLADQVIKEKNSHIRLVDLAGSERANNTGNTGIRLKEGSNINKSLTTLGRILAILSENSSSSSKQVVPYRESALTWLLKESIGGNSKTCMICCISPTDYEETVSSLRYATLTKKIQNRAVVNDISTKVQDLDQLEIIQAEERAKLNRIIVDLRQQLDDNKNRELIKLSNIIKFNNDIENDRLYKMKMELKEKDKLISWLQERLNQSCMNVKHVVEENLNPLYDTEWKSFKDELTLKTEQMDKDIDYYQKLAMSA